MESEDKIFCEKLRNIREGLRMSQQEFADSIGIKRPTYGNYETGVTEPTLTFFRGLRNAHKIDLNWLVCGEGEDLTDRTVLAEPLPNYTARISPAVLSKLLADIQKPGLPDQRLQRLNTLII